jgi:hypothetical protein
MTSSAKRRLEALSAQLVAPAADPGTFENMPKIREIAPNSAGQYDHPLPIQAL